MEYLGSEHFLSLPRPDIHVGPPAGVPDTTTLAAHDFDVDTRTGFMPPQPPLARLPTEWEPWEEALEAAVRSRIQLGSRPNLSETDQHKSEMWRERIRALPILETTKLKVSELALRRAHHVLAWIMHFYIHSLPPSAPIRIPAPITLPLLQVSAELQLPPILTYSDDVLYNWKFASGQRTDETGNELLPTIANIEVQSSFTGTKDESEFYLTSARMELRGVEALELMRGMMDEAFVGDDIAIRRITDYLQELSIVIKELGEILVRVKETCSPNVFYNEIRPWFRGEDSQSGREWEFEGIEMDETLSRPTELSGASAGQSTLIHALDVFMGVYKHSHSHVRPGTSSPGLGGGGKEDTRTPKFEFLKRMELYMPRHHRAFLNHLANNPRPIRDLVTSKSLDGTEDGKKLLEAYNAAVLSLKEFRDKHMIIVALYIIGPARRNPIGAIADLGVKKIDGGLKGTGGTEIVKFLKGVRDQTRGALLEE